MSASEKSKKSPKTKKKTVAAVVAGIAAATAAGFLIFSGVFSTPGVKPNYVPEKLTGDFSPELFVPLEEDEKYLALDRDVHYEYAGVGVILTDDSRFSDSGDCARLFKDFFDALKAGDADALKACFVDGYFESNDSPDGLQPQRVYDIWVSYYSGSENVKLGDAVYEVENFKVLYKLRFNDLTFRADTVSDVWKPQIFQVALVDGEYRIVNVNQFYS